MVCPISLLQLLAVTAAVYLARRFFDCRSSISLGLDWGNQARRESLAGFILAVPMLGLVVIIEWSLGWLRFEGFTWQAQPHPPPSSSSL